MAITKINRIRWAGHVEWMGDERHLMRTLCAKSYGDRRIGRLRITCNAVRSQGIERAKLGVEAVEHETWKRIVRDALTRLGL